MNSLKDTNLNTLKLSEAGKVLQLQISNEILDTLIGHYGRSKHFDWYPNICLDDSDSILSGEFRDDEEAIVLYPNAFMYNVDALAVVICHEFIHYLQCPKLKEKYDKQYEYYDHPMEIEAYRREDEILKLL